MGKRFVFVTVLLGIGLTGCAPNILAVNVSGVHLNLYQDKKQRRIQTLRIDWESESTFSIKKLKADIKAYDAKGRLVADLPNRVIYEAPDGQPGIKGEEKYQQPEEDAIIIVLKPGQEPAVKADVMLASTAE